MSDQTTKPRESAVSESAADAWISALANLVSVRSPLSGTLADRLASRTDLSATQRIKLDRLVPWAQRVADPAPAPQVRTGEIPFGVLGYRAADYAAASKNIGDWVQTLAMMSHLVRRPDVRLVGQGDLVELFTELQSRVPEERHIAGPSGTVHLVEFNRDASFYDALPEKTWAFIFGWYFKLPFGRHPEFPFNPRIIPIFLSFHISRGDQLSEEGYAYLREHGPIGCRDWFTVRLLIDKGVPAYFSGCVTTTIGSLFPPAEPDLTKPVVYVDAEPPADAGDDVVRLTNLINGLRDRTLAESLAYALKRLNSLRTDYSRIVTSRLHTYLPALSCGLTTEWQPKIADDRRFHGLAGPTAEPLGTVSERVSRIAKAVLDAILSGKSEREVYTIYRAMASAEIYATSARLAAEDVAAAAATKA